MSTVTPAPSPATIAARILLRAEVLLDHPEVVLRDLGIAWRVALPSGGGAILFRDSLFLPDGTREEHEKLGRLAACHALLDRELGPGASAIDRALVDAVHQAVWGCDADWSCELQVADVPALSPPAPRPAPVPMPREPEGFRGWLEANGDRMRVAYAESERGDYLLAFASRQGAPRASQFRAIVLALVSAFFMLDRRRDAARGAPALSAGEIAERWAADPANDAAQDAIAAIEQHIRGEVDLATDAEERAHFEALENQLRAAGRAKREELGPNVPEGDERAGLLIFESALLDLTARVLGACRLDATEAREPAAWAATLTHCSRLANDALGGMLANFVRRAIPFDSLATARAWSAPAPFGRDLERGGAPQHADPTSVHDWAMGALKLGVAPAIVCGALFAAVDAVDERAVIVRPSMVHRARASVHEARAAAEDGFDGQCEDQLNDALCQLGEALCAPEDESDQDWAETAARRDAIALPILIERLPAAVGDAMAVASSWRSAKLGIVAVDLGIEQRQESAA